MFRFRLRSEPRSKGGVGLLTFRKAGSQWIRDLLTHPLVTKSTGFYSVPVSRRDNKSRWPEMGKKQVVGPIYAKSREDWIARKSAGDKAIVVLRDPRDIIVSLHYSVACSHVPTKVTDRFRASLLRLSLQQSLMVHAGSFLQQSGAFASWATRPRGPQNSVFLTSYERMVSDSEAELAAVYEFLRWPISRADVRQIVHDLSFETRSGRERGDEDIFSHYRKGVTGDWRSHFDRSSGVLFESLFPRLLVDCGYENDPRWFEKLPVSPDERFPAFDVNQLKPAVELQAEVVRLREMVRWLEQKAARPRAA